MNGDYSNIISEYSGDNISEQYKVNPDIFNYDVTQWSCDEECKVLSSLYIEAMDNAKVKGVFDPTTLSVDKQALYKELSSDFADRATHQYNFDQSVNSARGDDRYYKVYGIIGDSGNGPDTNNDTRIIADRYSLPKEREGAIVHLFTDTMQGDLIPEDKMPGYGLDVNPSIDINGKPVAISEMSMDQLITERNRIELKYGDNCQIDDMTTTDMYLYGACSDQITANMYAYENCDAVKNAGQAGARPDDLEAAGVKAEWNPALYGIDEKTLKDIKNGECDAYELKDAMFTTDAQSKIEIIREDRQAKEARMDSYNRQNIGYQIEADKMAEAHREADKQAKYKDYAKAEADRQAKINEGYAAESKRLREYNKQYAEQSAMPQTTPVETTPQTDTVETTVPQTSTPSTETKSAEAETSEATSPTVNSNGTVQATNKSKEEIQLTDEEFMASQTLITIQGAYGNDKERHENLVKACVAQYGNGVDYNSLTDEQRKEYEAKADAIQANVNEKMKDSDYLHGRGDDFAKANEAKGKWSSKFAAMNKAAENESKNQGTEKQNQNDGAERG